jgi:hypothetical protein
LKDGIVIDTKLLTNYNIEGFCLFHSEKKKLLGNKAEKIDSISLSNSNLIFTFPRVTN